MATLRKINTPIRNPLTTANLRSKARSGEQTVMNYPGLVISALTGGGGAIVGQQIGATVADPFGFKAAIDGYKQDFKNSLPTFLVGAAVLIVGLILIWTGLNAFVIPTATRVAGSVAKAVA